MSEPRTELARKLLELREKAAKSEEFLSIEQIDKELGRWSDELEQERDRLRAERYALLDAAIDALAVLQAIDPNTPDKAATIEKLQRVIRGRGA